MKLTAERIVDAGMAVFAESGYHGLSMRRVAQRLDVHAGSLYYHVPNKSALVQLMADRVARQAYEAGTAALVELGPGAGWQERVETQLVALRGTLRRHPGGAVMFADSPKVLSTAALALMERLLETLAEAGVPAADCAVGADALLSHVTGFVLQEQSRSPAVAVGAEEGAALRERFPVTVAAASAFGGDEKFVRSVRLLCTGLDALLRS
ncbi:MULTISPECIES: TetR/AcrR family transcriptional regulator [unclassified Streptomyces]|uniref:TetR/AcrR family transcriptional regulator n=1 Tax=unclassified Streptomyces TaxID=2593676 RepID=UPI002E2FE3F2|nr:MULTISPECIES: TetR/AcrR family transcriptional regulator [unclassified Streptomyces]WUC67957.1 TetR/AcrR family transcriptional regulator [Streptomyces sp. NBC_00539]